MKRGRGLAWLVGGVGVMAALLLATLTMPVPVWRTGHEAWPPLPAVPANALPDRPNRLWIDTDAACDAAPRTDPDDCLALLALLRRTAPRVVGVSTVFGNAPLPVTDAITRELVARIAAATGAQAVAVHRGCAAPSCAEAPAATALRASVSGGPVTVLALGPLTNIALALRADPTLARSIKRIVAVMGRRPGHVFHPSENRSSAAMLFGHGPVFRDLNLALDPQAARSVLAAGIPVTLVPYEAARQVLLTPADLDRLASQDAAAAWVAARSRGWLDEWRRHVGLDGFYPFDLLGAIAVRQPRRLDCAAVDARVGRDGALWPFARDDALLVTPTTTTRPSVLYCFGAGAATAAEALARDDGA